MSNILQLVLVLLFDSYKPFFIAMRCLYILGAWMLLKKSGLPAFWSLVPWVREYQLGRSAGREPEGRSFCVTSMLITVLQLANICFRWNRDSRTLSAFVPLILVFLFSVMLMHFVFNIRVFAGFVQIYGVSRAWLIGRPSRIEGSAYRASGAALARTAGRMRWATARSSIATGSALSPRAQSISAQ